MSFKSLEMDPQFSTLLRKPVDDLSYLEAQSVTFFLEPLTLRELCNLLDKHSVHYGKSSPEHISAYHILYHAHMAFNGPFISTDAHFASIRSIFNALLNKIQSGFISGPICKIHHAESSSSSAAEKPSSIGPAANVHSAAVSVSTDSKETGYALVGPSPSAVSASKLPELKGVFHVGNGKPISSIGIVGSDSDARKVIGINLSNAWVKSQTTISESEKDVRSNRLTWTSSVAETCFFYHKCLAEFGSGTIPEKARCLILETNNADFGNDLNCGYEYVHKLIQSATNFNLLVIVVLPFNAIFLHNSPYCFQSLDLTYILRSDTASVLAYVKIVSPSTLLNAANHPEAGLRAFYAKNRALAECIVISSMTNRTHTVLRTNTYAPVVEKTIPLAKTSVPLFDANPAVDHPIVPATNAPSSSAVKEPHVLPELKDVFRNGGEKAVHSVVVNGSDLSTRRLAALNLVDAWVDSQVTTTKDSEKEIRTNRYTHIKNVVELVSLYHNLKLENGAAHKKARCIFIETDVDFLEDRELGYGYIDNLKNFASVYNLILIIVPHATIYNHTRPWWFRSLDLLFTLRSNTDAVMDYIRSVSPGVNYAETEAGLKAFYAEKREPMNCIVISSMMNGGYVTVLTTDISATKVENQLPSAQCSMTPPSTTDHTIAQPVAPTAEVPIPTSSIVVKKEDKLPKCAGNDDDFTDEMADAKRKCQLPLDECYSSELFSSDAASSQSLISEDQYVARPQSGWTLETFPKPKSGVVLLSYEDSCSERQFVIPVEKIDAYVWEVLICMDGERISEDDYYCFENEWDIRYGMDKYYADVARSHKLWRKIKASRLVHPGNKNTPDAPILRPLSFELYKQYELPPLCRFTYLSQLCAIIEVKFYYDEHS